MPTGYFLEVGGRVEQQERATQSLTIAIAAALIAVFALLYLALGSFAETGVILATIPSAFVGGRSSSIRATWGADRVKWMVMTEGPCAAVADLAFRTGVRPCCAAQETACQFQTVVTRSFPCGRQSAGLQGTAMRRSGKNERWRVIFRSMT